MRLVTEAGRGGELRPVPHPGGMQSHHGSQARQTAETHGRESYLRHEAPLESPLADADVPREHGDRRHATFGPEPLAQRVPDDPIWSIDFGRTTATCADE